MIDELKRICELQPAYTSANSPEMEERGRLIRRVVPERMSAWREELARALGPFGEDLGIEGSDGIGRKTEAPWVRVFSERMSPAPTQGFYVVMHFAADGTAVFVTVGFGATFWSKGDLKSVSKGELARRRAWGRSILFERFGDFAPFEDEIALGAKAELPRTFERATVVAKRVSVEELDPSAIRALVLAATERLRTIYEAQSVGRDVDLVEVAERELADLSRPGGRGQGFGLTAAERAVVERRAMVVAQAWLQDRGFKVKDTSKTKPYDFRAISADRELKVEVKGTTGDRIDAILMTQNEVELHRSETGATALVLVSRIRLVRGEQPVAEGGDAEGEIGWDIDAWERVPLAYRLWKPLVRAG